MRWSAIPVTRGLVVAAAVILALGVLTPARTQEPVTLRFSNWHLVETVWGRSLREAALAPKSTRHG